MDNRKKNLLSSNISSTCPHNIVNFGPLEAEIGPVVWGTLANFNGFGALAALLHGTPVLGVSQALRRWTEGATDIRQGGHHVGHWPTFLVCPFFTVSLFRFLIRFTYFLLLPIPSLSTRIVPLRFQAGGCRKRPNLGLVCCAYFVLCVLLSYS